MKNTFQKTFALQLWAVVLGTVWLLAGCTTSVNTSVEEKNDLKTDTMKSHDPHIAHYVLFWLREDLTEQEVQDFAQFFEDLKPIPGIKSLHYGRPADTHPRDVVDNSFTYNLVVYFDTMEDLEVYENHKIHLDAIAKYSPNWTKVVVHDSWLNQ